MKVLILSISGGGVIHLNNENAQRETWVKRLPEMAEIFWIKGNPEILEPKLDLNNNEIYLPIEEKFENLLPKTLLAMKFCLEKFDFKYLIRINNSSYYDPKLLMQTLEKVPSNEFYGGVEGAYEFNSQSVSFISGAGIWLSRDVVERLISMNQNLFTEFVDDVAIGAYLKNIRRHPISRQNVTDYKPLYSSAHTRVKHWSDDAVTVSRMHNLDKIYNSSSKKELRTNLLNFDKFEFKTFKRYQPFSIFNFFYILKFKFELAISFKARMKSFFAALDLE